MILESDIIDQQNNAKKLASFFITVFGVLFLIGSTMVNQDVFGIPEHVASLTFGIIGWFCFGLSFIVRFF